MSVVSAFDYIVLGYNATCLINSQEITRSI